ncbi:HlyD family efflux transporter periplasmic adaptor subunit [Xanthomonas translucens pv. undulosa]|uniref:HlyD family secretion protein n=1 Tax=Xanthomonas campestris pv. translucens TaxID=343 RepID=UPI003CFAD69A
MSDLFRPEALDAASQRYGAPLGLMRRSLWLATLLLAAVTIAAIATMCLMEYVTWELQPGVTMLEEVPVPVNPPYRSTVTRILVREGQRVAAGDPLVELEVVSSSDIGQDPVARVREQRNALLTSKREATALVKRNGQTALSLAGARIEIAKAQILAVSADLERQRAEVVRLGDFLKRLKEPRFADALPKTQVLDYESRYTSAMSAASSLERQLLQMRSDVLLAKEEQGKLATDVELTRSEAAGYEGEYELDRLSSAMEKGGTVYAPAAGTVANVLARLGSEVDPTEPMLSLVNPSSPVIGVIMAPGDQAAFLRRGDQVKLRFHSWSHRTKGEVSARVKELSRVPVHLSRQQLLGYGETKPPLYRITLSIDDRVFKRVSQGRPLIAGLSFDGVIVKQSTSLIDRLVPNARLKEDK